MGRVVGIDLGTTYSCVALVADGKPQVIPSRHGDNTIPSILAHDGKGNRLVGYAAKRQSVINPKDTIYGAKRLMGRNYHTKTVDDIKTHFHYDIVEGKDHEAAITVAGQHYELTEVSAQILEEIKNVAQDYLDEKVDRAVISVPAYFNNKQREAVRLAGEMAGLEVLRIINEPTAAALAYGFGKKLKEKILIYDLGGGTFDVTVLELFEDVYEVIAVGGDSFLGGLDFDERITKFAMEEFKRAEGVDLSGDALATQRIRDAAEKAKRDLSIAPEAEIVLPFITMVGGVSKTLKIKLTREKYDELTADLIARTRALLEQTLAEAKLDRSNIDDVVLVGGMTRMPSVQRMIEGYFGKPAKKGVHPDEVVALGAAILAHALESGENPVTLVDVVPVSIGIGLAGGRFRRVIEKNVSIPCERVQVFPTSRDDQPAMRIRVFQGENENVADNELLGEFIFANLRKGKAGSVKVEVKFKLDNECILHVAARDPDTGQSVVHSFSTEAAATRETYRADKVGQMTAEQNASTEQTTAMPAPVQRAAASGTAVKAPPQPAKAPAPAAKAPAQAAAPAKSAAAAPQAAEEKKPGFFSRLFGKK